MTGNINSAAVSDRGLSEKRPQNEDSYLELPAHGLFAVADGVGGAQAGDVASQMAMEILGEAFSNSRSGGDVEELMQLAIVRANGAIFQMSHDLPQLSTMATTVVALHVDGNIATIGHVGDSRLYRVDPKGNLYRETQDHSVVEEEVRAGRMTPAQAANHPSRNVISRALGAENTVEVDMKTMMIEPHTMFLLCSDGITRHIEDHEIRQLLSSGHPPSQICDDMKHICYSRGAEDNLTAVIVRVEQTGVASSDDIEESTAASARPAIVSNASFDDTIRDTDFPDMRTHEMNLSDDEDDDSLKTQESIDTSKFAIPPSNATERSPESESFETLSPAATSSYQDTKYDDDDEVKSGGIVGKLLGALIFLLIGAGIGAAGYHFYMQKQSSDQQPVAQKTPEMPQMQTSNIPYKSFEDTRRSIDKNPEQYIAANGTTADDAEDFYLLGRAYLLSGKYVEAKESFTSAKSKLPQVSGDNKAMLTNEIAIGLSIVDSTFSKKVLEAEKGTGNTGQTSNTNSSNSMETKTLGNQSSSNKTDQ